MHNAFFFLLVLRAAMSCASVTSSVHVLGAGIADHLLVEAESITGAPSRRFSAALGERVAHPW